MSKFKLTNKDYRVIFEMAHREWLHGQGISRGANNTEELLLAKCYFKAVVFYLKSRGYTIEKSDGEKGDRQ